MKITRILAGALATVVALTGLTACGASSSKPDPSKPLVIVADIKPHAALLKEAEKLGLLGTTKITIKEIAGEIDVNQLTASGDVDANFFQHVPYLNDWNKQHNSNLVSVGGTHIEPLGLYSKKVKAVTETPDGAIVAIPADPTNLARALFLLSDAKLLTLNVKASDPGLDFSQITEKNITENPKNLKFVKIDRPQLFASLADPKVVLSVVNGNYAIEGGLIPKTDALVLESADNNPYVNILVTRPELKDDPRVRAVAKALVSPEIAKFIDATYQGSVLPAK